ncbi:MAG TPA: basic amino acid ABC transporter substrate-binding protein [Defluviitaleaceae bacterium]|nr:basic amino acid ABC transporter substrate-binding protein [Candidatus Epulonipiscium sp.]HOA81710.1 basic amino acid ABC transporter substrate-binding protein [Defluviitaleaceae bacterium]
MKKIISIIIAATMLFALAGCGKDAANNSSNNQGAADGKKIIVMGTNAEFPPFEYREGEKVVGFDVEIAKKIAEKLGAELQIEDMTFGGLIPALEAGKIDFIAAGMSITEERKKNVDFSNGYYKASQVIITLKDNTEINGPEDLENKTIGVQLGTTGDEEAQKIQGAEIIQFNAGYAAIMDLQNDKLDAVVLDYEPARNFASQNDKIQILPVELTQEEYAIAVRKGNQELVDAINTVLEEMKESGEYDKLVEEYFSKE